MIFASLEKEHLKTARVVCSLWRKVATDYLFDRIYFSRFPKDIEVFEAWIANAECAAAVKEMIYDVTVLDAEMSLSEYTSRLLDRFSMTLRSDLKAEFPGPDRQVQEIWHFAGTDRLLKPDEPFVWPPRCPDPSFEDDDEVDICQRRSVPPCFLEYPSIPDGHQDCIRQARYALEMQASGKMLAVLKSGLKRLPNLKCIILQGPDGCGIGPLDAVAPSLRRKCGPPSFRKRHAMHLPPWHCTFNNLSSLSAFVWPTDSDINLGMAYYKQHAILFQAVSEQHTNLDHLKLELPEWRHFSKHVFPELIVPGATLPSEVDIVFGHLKVLDVTIDSESLGSDEDRGDGGFTQCLMACNSLEELVLSRCYRPWFPRSIGGSSSLPNLRRLKVKGGVIGTDALAMFICEHQLQNLEMSKVRVEEYRSEPTFSWLSKAVAFVPQVHILASSTPYAERRRRQCYIQIDICGSDVSPTIREFEREEQTHVIEVEDWSSSIMNTQSWKFDRTEVMLTPEYGFGSKSNMLTVRPPWKLYGFMVVLS